MPAIINAKLSQRTLRSYWSIPFTQELPGKNHSHVRLLPTKNINLADKFSAEKYISGRDLTSV
jgi:hypothetical protein